jgi:nitric oxide reductase subunit B
MSTQLQLQSNSKTVLIKDEFKTDKIAIGFLVLSMSYLVFGLLFGLIGGFQYILPDFLKDQLNFAKTRPLHVYLAISWIFTASQGAIYYYLPRIAQRNLYWQGGVKLHLFLQTLTSLFIISAFFGGYFGGREYLEFPPSLGFFIAITWLPFLINFFFTLKPNYKTAPVYIYSWSIGIIFFYITLSESYLWVLDFFGTNEIRDITVQWKALGSMVGSWNMLVYGSSIYVLQQLTGNEKIAKSPLSFFFFFLGFTNLLFNWGHHTYIVPAAPWVKTVAYVISMTELLIFANIIWQFKKSFSDAQKNFHKLPYRIISFADAWIFINLGIAIAISIPALNYYTHGTHITVAHAMGTTIGINTMLLFASVFFILKKQYPLPFVKNKKSAGIGITITNVALIIFFTSLVGSGLIKISGKLENASFFTIMEKSKIYFQIFSYSGIFIFIGLVLVIYAAFKMINNKTIDQRKTRAVKNRLRKMEPASF